jgi:hypothetical protein
MSRTLALMIRCSSLASVLTVGLRRRLLDDLVRPQQE